MRGALALLLLFLGVVLASDPFPFNKVSTNVKLGGVKEETRRLSLEATISHAGADWIRLIFAKNSNAPMIRITSLLDGAVQHLNPVTLAQWQYSSAYFNGDSVLVEIFDQRGRIQDYQVVVEELHVGVNVPGRDAKSLCGPDSRELSSFKKAGRYLGGGGCSAWLIDDKRGCFLTAHHCSTDSTGSGVVEFEVPLSVKTPLGHQIVHPAPEHQYALDPASLIRAQSPVGIGNDWQYFGVFPNTETGLTPKERQQQTYFLSTNFTAPAAGADIRIVGYGVVEFDKPAEWNQVQKVSFGPFSHDKQENNGRTWSVHYTVDTTGGDSGSAIELGSEAIGIHTHGGCSRVFGGVNSGTFIGNPSLQAALKGPKGVCA